MDYARGLDEMTGPVKKIDLMHETGKEFADLKRVNEKVAASNEAVFVQTVNREPNIRFRLASDGTDGWYVQDSAYRYYPMDMIDESHAREIETILNRGAIPALTPWQHAVLVAWSAAWLALVAVIGMVVTGGG